MTPTSIIAMMRRISKVNTTQYSDADALIDLNALKDEFWSVLVNNTSQDYNWEEWSATTVALQSEYSIPQVAYNTAGAKLLNGVAINYDGKTYEKTGEIIYTKAKLVNQDSLEYDWGWYEENQSQDFPIYRVSDSSVFIAPVPRSGEDGSNRMRLTGIRKIPDYTLSTTEADMRLPVDVHQALVYGLAYYGLINKGVDDATINNWETRWLRRRGEAIKTLEARVVSPVYMPYPEESDVTVI